MQLSVSSTQELATLCGSSCIAQKGRGGMHYSPPRPLDKGLEHNLQDFVDYPHACFSIKVCYII